METKVLFICEMNRIRSKTAERLFSLYPDLEVRSAGMDDEATRPITFGDLEWADLVFVMEQNMAVRLYEWFPMIPSDKKIVALEIYDDFNYMDPTLLSLLLERVSAFI